MCMGEAQDVGKSRRIQAFDPSDRQGGTSTFAFTNLRENRALSDKLFEFKVPKGVDVVTNDPR